MTKHVYLSMEGKNLLVQKIQNILTEIEEIRAEKAIAYTLSGDTWHDNPGFNALEQSEHRKVSEVLKLQNILSTAKIKNIIPRPIKKVDIGSIVEFIQIVDSTGDEENNFYEIVGYGESNPSLKKISYDSPIGSMLFGLSIGECKENGLYIPAKCSICHFEIVKLYSSWDEVNKI